MRLSDEMQLSQPAHVGVIRVSDATADPRIEAARAAWMSEEREQRWTEAMHAERRGKAVACERCSKKLQLPCIDRVRRLSLKASQCAPIRPSDECRFGANR